MRSDSFGTRTRTALPEISLAERTASMTNAVSAPPERPFITAAGVGILFLLICISTLGFTLYNKLLSCNPVGKVAIFNSLIPVVGAVTSCLCLGEPFYWKYLVAALLAMTGIYIINARKG